MNIWQITNIKIQSLKSDSFDCQINNINYVKDSFKLYLESEFARPFESVEKLLYSSPRRWEKLGEVVLTRTKTEVSPVIFRY